MCAARHSLALDGCAALCCGPGEPNTPAQFRGIPRMLALLQPPFCSFTQLPRSRVARSWLVMLSRCALLARDATGAVRVLTSPGTSPSAAADKMSAQDLDQAFREAVTSDGPDGGWSIKNDERVKYVGKLEVTKGDDATLKVTMEDYPEAGMSALKYYTIQSYTK